MKLIKPILSTAAACLLLSGTALASTSVNFAVPNGDSPQAQAYHNKTFAFTAIDDHGNSMGLGTLSEDAQGNVSSMHEQSPELDDFANSSSNFTYKESDL